MVKIIKIILSVILLAILFVFPYMASKYIDLKADKDSATTIENPTKMVSSFNYLNLLDIAEQDYNANEDMADSAPKQTVVALWGIRDTQSILVMENSEIISQNYDLSYELKKDAQIINNNIMLQSNKISIILFYMLLPILVIGVIAILLFIWKSELKLNLNSK